MQTIKYKFADATTNEVEVTEEIYLIHLELLQHEKRNHWEETQRHTSLYYFTDMGIDFEDKRHVEILPPVERKSCIQPRFSVLEHYRVFLVSAFVRDKENSNDLQSIEYVGSSAGYRVFTSMTLLFSFSAPTSEKGIFAP